MDFDAAQPHPKLFGMIHYSHFRTEIEYFQICFHLLRYKSNIMPYRNTYVLSLFMALSISEIIGNLYIYLHGYMIFEKIINIHLCTRSVSFGKSNSLRRGHFRLCLQTKYISVAQSTTVWFGFVWYGLG